MLIVIVNVGEVLHFDVALLCLAWLKVTKLYSDIT